MNLTPSHYDYLLGSTANYIACVQKENLEPYIEEVCNLIDAGENKICVPACHGAGKTHGLSCIVDALMTTNMEIKIITTAPTFRQVELLLWKEIKTRYGSKPHEWRLGDLTNVRWNIPAKDGIDDSFAVGFSPSKEAGVGAGQSKQSPFQGFHAKNLTVVIFDEATGVPPQIWVEAEGLLTTANTLWICIGNPTARNSNFFRAYNDPSWAVVKITCFDTPNFIANGILCLDDMLAERDILLDILDKEGQAAYKERLKSYIVVRQFLIVVRWAMEKLIDWGPDHPLFQGKVLGEFPTEDENVLIPEHVVVKAQGRTYEIQIEDELLIGVDIARFGSDSTVFTGIVGWQQVGLQVHNKLDSIEVLRCLIPFIKESEHYGDRKIRIALDAGYGQGVIDTLTYWLDGTLNEDSIEPATDWDRENIIILEINFGSTDWVRWHYGWKDEKALREENLQEDRKVQEDRENFLNFKAKMFDLLARDLRNKLALLPEKVYVESLPTIILVPASDSKMKIESKEDYKKRTGLGSPDEGDSLALANLARTFAAKPLSVLEAFENY